MAHTVPEEPATVSQNETKQQRKKQAKKEAKLMLKVEAAKKDVQRAEQKVAKAQALLEDRRTHLHDLEEKLSQMRASSRASQNGRQASEAFAHPSTSTPTDQIIVVSLAEGQGEMPQESAGSNSPHQAETVSPAQEQSEIPQQPEVPPSDIYTPLPANPVETPPPTAERTEASQELDASDADTSIPPPTNQIEAMPPAEGRTDILPETTSSTTSQADAEIGSE